MVSIDDLVPHLALTAEQRRDLCRIGDFLEKHPGARGVSAQTARSLEKKGYAIEAAPAMRGTGVRFRLTERGEMRYRAELSHRRHCTGCTLCDEWARANLPREARGR